MPTMPGNFNLSSTLETSEVTKTSLRGETSHDGSWYATPHPRTRRDSSYSHDIITIPSGAKPYIKGANIKKDIVQRKKMQNKPFIYALSVYAKFRTTFYF